METGGETALSSGLYGERGAGGKLRKPPSRKPSTTPYSRPPSNEAARGQRRWLSGIVDPAYRLISGGATRLFPSFFSKSNSVNALPSPNDQNHDEQHTETEQNAIGDREDNADVNVRLQSFEINSKYHMGLYFVDMYQHQFLLFLKSHCALVSVITIAVNGISRTTEIVGPSKKSDRLISCSDFEGNKKSDQSDDIGLSEIEQLLKGKKFSRQVMHVLDEVNHLMEIIHSRAVEPPTVDHKKKNQSFSTAEQAKWPLITNDIPKSSEEKQEDLNKAIWPTSTPLPQSAIRDQVGASPVEIARAFMGSRNSEIDLSSKNAMSKDERATLHGDEFSSKPFLPTPSYKPSACWPGSMVQDQRDYSTPQTERGRFGLHNLPRTPYSRTIFSKSKSKVCQRTRRTLSTPLKQSQTPIYGQPRGDTLDGGYGSAGPVRRLRPKSASQSPATGSPYVHSSPFGPSRGENSSATKGFLPAAKNFELGGLSGNSQIQSSDRKSSSFGVPTVHPQSSLIARTILEHIDRNPPTPKDKSEELKLAFAWKKTPSSGVSSVIQNGHDSLPVGGFNSRKLINQDYQKNSAHENADKGNSLFKIPPVENTVKATTVANNIPAGDGRDGRSLSKSTNEDFLKIAPNVVGSGVLNQQNKPAFQSLEAKRAFPSISVDKPESKWAFSSGSSSGFTFPVSTSSAVFSELPTPSFMPSSLASSQHQPKEEGDAVPTYDFGSKKSDPLVFAFPSTSAEVQNDASDIKFSFGSDKPKLSFGSVGKDAICY
ncbi:hypothetical protein DVH24_029152 [Malus domestica]|uniref:Nuclear pore complex protein NUP1 n=1 Tax=Malus domestica TaxID=3750 RepID=A0A498HZ49_MALDO|nr:hypothetical protein DVH24_029152 [Malus domestica]